MAAGLAVATPAAAQAPDHVVLPVAAPNGAHPLLADFVAICSRAMLDFPSAVAEAGKRGWASSPAEGGLLEEAALAALGSVSLSKAQDDFDSLFLLVNKVNFPHLTSASCNLQLIGDPPAGLDTGPLSGIEGVLPGVLNGLAHPLIGTWSLLDEQDQVVTIMSVPLGNQGVSLVMNRSVRVEPPPPPKPAP